MTTLVATGRAAFAADARAAAEALASELEAKLGAPPVLVMAFASTAHPLAEVAPVLAARFPGAVVLGTSTAGEFTEASEGKASLAGFALAGEYKVFAGFGRGQKESPERAVREAVEGLPTEAPGYPYRTALLLVDSLAGAGEETSLLVAAHLGVRDQLAGGAAGDDLLMKSTVVSLGARAESDALAVAYVFSREPLGIGVAHGYEPTNQETMTVTRATGNTVHEIDGRPAWQVWMEKTKERAAAAGIEPTSDASFFFRFPAALKFGSSYKIRALIARNGDSIDFACGIPEGTVMHIAEGDALSQLVSARRAARRARRRLGHKPVAGALVFDCVVRKMILGDDFGTAVRTISEELQGAPLAGFASYGEIALEEGDTSGFHNTTSVVLAFPK